jgi:Zn-dependent protease
MFSCFSVKSGQNGIGVTIFGFTRSDAVNVAVGVLGYYSLMVAAFDLLPLPPLDGAKAWYLIPELIKRARNRGNQPPRKVGWRGW